MTDADHIISGSSTAIPLIPCVRNAISAGVQFRPFSSLLNSLRPLVLPALLLEGGILLLTVILRLWALDLKPAHFDEGINGWFVDQMRSVGFYRYDPENYHGPFYFYLLFASLSLLGRNLWALRLPAVAASIASVWVALRFDRIIGSLAARWGALALALSPAMVFYGRYAIHESWLVLALLITTRGLMGLWKEGGRRDLIIVFSGVTLMLLLKETAVIHLACFVLAGGAFLIWERLVPSRPMLTFAPRRWSMTDLAWCGGLSLLALIFFYSGTFLNFPGVIDFFRAYAKWFQTGTGAGGHVKTDYQFGPLNYYWLALMGRYEWPALAGLLYALRLAWPSHWVGASMMRYLSIYGLGVLIAYSIVPYKTPWCIISILWPFSLLFGCLVQEAWNQWRSPVIRLVTILLALSLLGVSLILSLRLNFKHCTDPTEPYVYVQTMPEIARLTEPVMALAHDDLREYAMSGQIVLESYYPLPWIFGDFTRIGYYDKVPAVLDGEFIVALTSKQKEVETQLKEPYLRRRFHLRDSMDECTVWFKESLFRNWFADPRHGTTERVLPQIDPSKK
jgi:uncharacterized protein (TIGR03663 family)